jgi:hypothetical protein
LFGAVEVIVGGLGGGDDLVRVVLRDIASGIPWRVQVRCPAVRAVDAGVER